MERKQGTDHDFWEIAANGNRGLSPMYALGSNEKARQEAYRELFRYQLDPGLIDEIRAATNGNYALGSASFQAQIATMLGRRATPGKSGRPCKREDSDSLDLFDGS